MGNRITGKTKGAVDIIMGDPNGVGGSPTPLTVDHLDVVRELNP